MKALGILIILLVNGLGLAAQVDSSESGAESFIFDFAELTAPYLGIDAPAFEAPDIAGELHRLDDLRGQVVVLHFWQLYCQPCLDQIPGLKKVMATYGERGVTVLGFADGYGADLEEFVVQQALNYPVIPNSAEFGAKHFGGEIGYPRLFIIDRYGVIQQVLIGGGSGADHETYQQLAPLIDDLLRL